MTLNRMPDRTSLTDFLKRLRGDRPVSALAKERQVGVSTIYKAEEGIESVKWPTIELVYGDLCKDEDQYLELLMLWAISQSTREVSVFRAREKATRLRDEANSEIEQEVELLGRSLLGLSPDERKLLIDYAARFRASKPTRDAAAAWVEAMRPV